VVDVADFCEDGFGADEGGGGGVGVALDGAEVFAGDGQGAGSGDAADETLEFGEEFLAAEVVIGGGDGAGDEEGDEAHRQEDLGAEAEAREHVYAFELRYRGRREIIPKIA
jgi:hypothetical protein